MKRAFRAIGIVVAIVLLTCMASSVMADDRIELLNPPPGGVLELAVGESYTFNIGIAEGTPFILAMAMPDAYYPGRAISWHGNDIAHSGNSAVLHLTMTATGSTDGFDEVCDWPEPGEPEPGECWPADMVPASIVVGVRFKGGVVLTERFNFAVLVP
jgi:hypothetical protein